MRVWDAVDAAVVTLRQASAAAMRTDLNPGPGQFVVSQTHQEQAIDAFGDSRNWTWIDRSDITTWTSADGTKPNVQLTIQLAPRAFRGEPLPPADVAGNPPGLHQWFVSGPCKPSPTSPTHAYLRSIPTDPTRLRAYVRRNYGAGPYAVWTAFSKLMFPAGLPSALESALYRLASTTPGLSYKADAVDGIGRHGVAVAITDSRVEDEMIFDRSSHRLLGFRVLQATHDKRYGPVGTVLITSTTIRQSIAATAPHPARPMGGDC